MYKDEHITLAICGNKESNSGYGTLVTVGEGFLLEDKLYAGMSNVPDGFYTLQIRNDISIVTKTVNKVSSYDGGRAGTLRIGLSVPKHKSVGNIYDLLTEVETTFKSRYMTQVGDRWFFKADPIDESIFRALVDRYPLMDSPVSYRPMQNGGPLAYLVAPDVRQLLADYQYPEFANYGEIVISAVPGESPSTFPGLKIPREASYSLVCKQIGTTAQPKTLATLVGQNNEFQGHVFTSDYYQNVTIPKFRVADLLGKPSYDWVLDDGNELSLDPASETVIFKYHLTPKTFQCRMTLQGIGKFDVSALTSAQFLLRSDVKVITLNPDFSFQLQGSDIALAWRLQYVGHEDLILQNESFKLSAANLNATVQVGRKAVQVPDEHAGYVPGGGGGKNPKQSESNASLDAEFPAVNISAEAYWGEDPTAYPGEIYGTLRCIDGLGQLVYADNISLRAENRKVRQDEDGSYIRYQVTKRLPKGTLGKSCNVRIEHVEFGKDKYYFELNSEQGFANVKALDFDGDHLEKKSHKNILIPAIAGLVGLLLGAALGLFVLAAFFYQSDKPAESEPNREAVTAPLPDPKVMDAQQNPQEDLVEDKLAEEPSAEAEIKEEEKPDASSPAAPQLNPNVKKQYDEYSKQIRELSFNFNAIEEIQKFLDTDEAKAVDASVASKTQKLSWISEQIAKISVALQSNDPSKMNADFGALEKSTSGFLTQQVRQALCAAHAGDYTQQPVREYDDKGSKQAARLARDCNTWQDLLNILKSDKLSYK